MGIFNNLKRLLNSLPEEKAFYAGVSFIVFLISCLVFLLIFINQKAILVPQYTNKSTFAIVGKVQFLLPMYANNDAEESISSLLFSGLTKKTLDGNYVNDLAESVSPDETGTQIAIKIKDDTRFSNGDEITSDDVIFTFGVLENPVVDAVNKVLYEGIKIEKVDEKNIRITLKKPYPRLMEALSVGIISKKDFQKENINNLLISSKNLTTVYSGQYYLDEIVNYNGYKTFVLKTNFKNSSNKPYIKNIDFKTYDDINIFLNDSRNNKPDIIINPPTEILDQKYISENYNKSNFILPRVVSLYLNPNKKDSFADKNLRSAIYSSINRENLASDTTFLGYAVPTYFILPDSKYEETSSTTPESNRVIFDKKLKSDIIEVTVSRNERQQKAAEFVKKSLEEYGLQVEIEALDATEIANDTIKNRNFEALLYSSEITSVYDLYAFLHSSQKNAPGLNITNYLSKNLDQNLEDIKNSTNIQDISNSLEKIKQEFYQEYPYIPLYTPTQNIIFKKNMNIELPNQVISYKDLFMNINNWNTGYEKSYSAFYDKNLINKIYSFIH